jgi:cobalt transporter subunit CbtA
VPVFRTIVFAAAVAGLLAGLLVSMAQQFGTVPLIQQAEVYETAAEMPSATAAGGSGHHDHGDHAQQAAWAPQDGFERTAFTVAANIVTGIGFALLLVAGFALRGRAIGWREGLLWGMAGFAVFTLAPSLGLPPELPGTPAGPLGARQVWWLLTAAATAAGLALLAFRASPRHAAAGVVLLVLPHLIGAPQPLGGEMLVPDSLARRFVVAVTVTSFLFWACLGVLGAYFFERFGRDRDLSPAG